MDLTNILNTKDGASAVAITTPHLGLAIEFQKQSYLSNPRDHPQSPAPSEFVSDREVSPHSSNSPSTSEHSSYAIQPAPASVNGQYSAAQLAPLNTGGRGPGRPSSGDPFSKAFPCSVCNKGFARRSDLARHGKFFLLN